MKHSALNIFNLPDSGFEILADGTHADGDMQVLLALGHKVGVLLVIGAHFGVIADLLYDLELLILGEQVGHLAVVQQVADIVVMRVLQIHGVRHDNHGTLLL